jgi:hypothetical protein
VASCLAFAYFFSYESAGLFWALVRHLDNRSTASVFDLRVPYAAAVLVTKYAPAVVGASTLYDALMMRRARD